MTRIRASPGGFGVTVCFAAGRVVVGVRGEVDLQTAPDLAGLLNALVDRGHARLVLDFADLEFLDAAGLRVMAEASARLHPSGSLSVRSPPPMTRRIMDLTGVASLVHIERADRAGVPDVPTNAAAHLSGPAELERAELAAALVRAAGSRATDVVDAALGLVVALAKATVRGADGAGVAVHRHGRLTMVASTDDTIERMERDQYATGEGPCQAAVTEGRSFHLESSAEEARWPAFVPSAIGAGIASVLSTPLVSAGRSVGAINLYSRTARAFGAQEQALAALFATRASDILSSGGVGLTAGELGDRLEDALRSREVIAEGQGVLMERHGISADAAYATLARSARRAEQPVRQQAAEVLASAGGAALEEAQARHG